MRIQWTIIPVLFVVAVVAVYNVCREAGGPVDTIVGMARRVTFGALYGLGFWAASLVLRRWMSQPQHPLLLPVGPPVPPIPTFAAFPGPAGPGQYRVRGVDRDSNFEITEVVFADSPSSAQLKVELKGVHVAAVERAP
jgi:hypothetical protein